MNGYVGFYKGKKFEVYANSVFEAQQKIAVMAKAKKPYEVAVMLAEKGGQEVTHLPLMNPRSNLKNKNIVIGYYNTLQYSVALNGEEVYKAGNSPYDSQIYVSANDGVGLAKMKSFCIQTSKDLAKEHKAKYLGVKYEKYSENPSLQWHRDRFNALNTLWKQVPDTFIGGRRAEAAYALDEGRSLKNPTYYQEMMSRFGLPFNPKDVKSSHGFRYGDRVVMASDAESWQSGVKKGDRGTVDAIRGIRGISVSPDPAGRMLFVNWDKYGQQSVWIGTVRKIRKV